MRERLAIAMIVALAAPSHPTASRIFEDQAQVKFSTQWGERAQVSPQARVPWLHGQHLQAASTMELYLRGGRRMRPGAGSTIRHEKKRKEARKAAREEQRVRVRRENEQPLVHVQGGGAVHPTRLKKMPEAKRLSSLPPIKEPLSNLRRRLSNDKEQQKTKKEIAAQLGHYPGKKNFLNKHQRRKLKKEGALELLKSERKRAFQASKPKKDDDEDDARKNNRPSNSAKKKIARSKMDDEDVSSSSDEEHTDQVSVDSDLERLAAAQEVDVSDEKTSDFTEWNQQQDKQDKGAGGGLGGGGGFGGGGGLPVDDNPFVSVQAAKKQRELRAQWSVVSEVGRQERLASFTAFAHAFPTHRAGSLVTPPRLALAGFRFLPSCLPAGTSCSLFKRRCRIVPTSYFLLSAVSSSLDACPQAPPTASLSEGVAYVLK
jgi:hypothetical protein